MKPSIASGPQPLWIRRGIIALAIILSGLSARVNAGEIFPRDQMPFPFTPASMVDGLVGLRLNPAAIGTDLEFALNYYHSYSDSSFRGDNGIYTSYRGFGFAVEWLGAGAESDGRSYTIGLATRGRQSLAFGSTYQWRSSDDPVQNRSHFWSTGLLWRPNNFLSLGAVAKNHRRMRTPTGRSDAEFVYSGAVSLLNGRWVVGGDWYQTTSQNLWDGTFRIGTSVEPSRGLTVYGDWSEDDSYSVGAKFDMSMWFVGTQNVFNTERSYQGGVAYVGVHQTRSKPLVNIVREAAYIDMSGEIPDRRPARAIFGSGPATTFDLVVALDKARHDSEIRAVVIRINDPELGWARREELRRAITRVREAGKFTVALLDGMVSNGEYYLATAADLIAAQPVSSIEVIGLRSEVTFAKRLLGKLGIVADLEHVGDYKNASDLLTRTTMSPEHREAVTVLLEDLDQYWVGELAEGRGTAPDRVRSWIDHGPYVSVDAQSAGLVDTVVYADEVPDLIAQYVGPILRTIDTRTLRNRTYDSKGWAQPAKVAVIFAEGGIREGRDGSEFLSGDAMGSETISKALRQARDNRDVKAVVLRVNSPGGSVFASDEILREVERTVGKKPIVVSFGDVAASGGYYIACAADSIFAMPNTITGSIGVIIGKLEFSEMYDKIGLDKEVLTTGPYADLHGSTGRYDADERAVIRAQMLRIYEHFVELVADRRDLPPDSVEAIAQGRVWSGTAARKRGLVDRFADLRETIHTAAHMAGIKPGEDLDVVVLPEPGWQLFSADGLGIAAWLPSRAMEDLFRRILITSGISRDQGEGASVELPYRITIQ